MFECLKRFDLFGYQVKLRVDKNNINHRTYLGACVSLIYLVGIIYILVQFTGQSAQNLKFPSSWVAEIEDELHKVKLEELKIEADVKKDADKIKEDADKLK